MSFFDIHGRCIPVKGARVFGDNPSFYYSIKNAEIDYQSIFDRSVRFGRINDITLTDFSSRLEYILKRIESNSDYCKVLNGFHVPFIYKCPIDVDDLGYELESVLLPSLKESFIERYPGCHFKAVLQSNSKLKKQVSIVRGSGYERLQSKSKNDFVIGWYFPQALQEYDIDSQRLQYRALPKIDGVNVCLSGGADICSAVTGFPDLLINDETYAPVLCFSALAHTDTRLVLLLKSYGPHLEFWCMTQMLSKGVTQVSEQWAGGLTFFEG